MKKIALLVVSAFLFPLLTFAQNDWLNTSRYSQENKNINTRPKAVFMGDSITQCWPDADPDFLPDNNFLGRGISGQTTSHMLCRFRSDVIELNPEYVVILAGTNDVALNNGPISLEDMFRNVVSMCELAVVNGIKPVICSVLPCSLYHWRPEVTDAADKILKFNEMLKDYASRKNFTYVDYHTPMKDAENGLPKNLSYDGCHPTLEGYKVMEAIVLEALK